MFSFDGLGVALPLRRIGREERGVCYRRPPSDEWGGGGMGGSDRLGGGGVLKFKNLAQAIRVLRWDLVARLEDPTFSFADLSLDGEEIFWWDGYSRRKFNPLLDALALHRNPQHQNPTQLTEEDLARHPELKKLYEKKVGPLLIKIWEEAYDLKCRGVAGELLPRGLFNGTAQGKLNFDIVFRYVVEKKMGLVFDRSTRTVDPRLRRENQEGFLASQLHLPPKKKGDRATYPEWEKVISHYHLQTGLEVVYGDSVYAAFSDPDNYGWAFEYRTSSGRPIPEGQHLHWSDFKQRIMWDDLSRHSKAWREIDHIIRQHWGVVVYDSVADSIDPRLFPEQHDQLIAHLTKLLGKEKEPFEGWNDLFNRAGFAGLLVKPEIKGHPGAILKLRYLPAFQATEKRREHLRVHWFKEVGRFPNVEAEREALTHEIEDQKIPWAEVPRRCTRHWLRSVHLETLLYRDGRIAPGLKIFRRAVPRLEIFKRTFPEKFKDGTWHEGDFPAVGIADTKEVAPRKIAAQKPGAGGPRPIYGEIFVKGLRFYVPLSYVGRTLLRVSADHAIIYDAIPVFGAGGKRISFRPVKALLFGPHMQAAKTARQKGVVIPDSAFIPLEDERIPPHKELERLVGDLLEAGIFPHALGVAEQKLMLSMYRQAGERGLEQFIASYKGRESS